VVVGVFILSLFGFSQVKQSFFPDSTSPIYLVDFWFPEGTSIEETALQLTKAEDYFLADENTEDVVSFIGGSQIRFLLTYSPEKNYACFGQLLIRVKDYKAIPQALKTVQTKLEEMYPQAIIHTKPFVLGLSIGGKIQLRIYGPDGDELRKLGRLAEDILRADPAAQVLTDRKLPRPWRPLF
jgi:multidrug efflux pump subunit AcrB